jgi:L-seryl-tRNA(Ser) seleniumtransferase
VGGGALPTAELPTYLVSLSPPRMSAAELAERLRLGEPPVIARLQQERLLLDLRTVEPSREPDLVAAVRAACAYGAEMGS